jgi:hypothetical protein
MRHPVTNCPKRLLPFRMHSTAKCKAVYDLAHLVSPPGSGKTTLLQRLHFQAEVIFAIVSAWNGNRTFLLFDCSDDDRLAAEPVVSLLNTRFEGVELDRDGVVLVMDEFHMLPQRKKEEFFTWVMPRLDRLKVVMISNRTDRCDQFAERKLGIEKPKLLVGGTAVGHVPAAQDGIVPRPRFIWHLRIPHALIVSAVHRTVGDNKALEGKGAAALEVVRLLVGDEGISLRLATSIRSETFGSSSGGTMTHLEMAFTRMHPSRLALFRVCKLLALFDQHRRDLTTEKQRPELIVKVIEKLRRSALDPKAAIHILVVAAVFLPHLKQETAK